MNGEQHQEHDGDACVAASRVEEQDAVLDRVDFPLTDEEFRQFEALLDSAPEPNNALRQFIRQRPPWSE